MLDHIVSSCISSGYLLLLSALLLSTLLLSLSLLRGVVEAEGEEASRQLIQPDFTVQSCLLEMPTLSNLCVKIKGVCVCGRQSLMHKQKWYM